MLFRKSNYFFRSVFLAGLLVWLVQENVNAQVAATITMWKDSAIGAIWNGATNTVAYGKVGANGYYKIYLSDSLGNNETPLTYAGWPADRHQWAEEWDPTGQYLFCYVEKTAYVWETDHLRIPEDAIPGYGAYTDVWLLKRDGSQAWQLTNVPNDYDNGVCHGAISEDGTLFSWTERILAPDIWNPNLAAGAYVFKTATVTYGPNPSLTNIQTYQPGSVLAGGEVESISPDNSTIAVYSTFESQNIIATPLYTIDLATGATTRLTTFSFSQCPTYTPDGNHFVYMTGHECDIFPWQLQGADWWIMDTDSTNKIRLTYMNVTGHPQCVDMYRLAGSLSFMSNTSFLGGIMTQSLGLTGYTAKVSFANVVGVEEPVAEENIQSFPVFPNPATNQITLGLPENLYDFTVVVNDVTGREVVRKENERNIDVASLAQGSYLVVVTCGSTTYRQLFSKQ
ncbi:MAG TPA: T9SS type A sorting domain-containing protein [Bacteroidia bacterium]|nr:T9SS type A sorting domain-containing protein [Bacteroidia bacterium]